VPVAAAGQADVCAADPDPAVGGGVGQHRLDQLRVAALEGDALGERGAGLGDPAGERVAQLLQLAEVEHAGRPGGLDPMRDADPAEPLGDEATQLQLELADLAAELGARRELVDLDSLKQSRHSQSLSRLEGRGGNP
jgi:hypothetical protein